jgi:hypothetical protein
MKSPRLDRRQFLAVSALAGPAALSAAPPSEQILSAGMIGKLRHDLADAPLSGASWYLSDAEGDGLSYRFPAGTLAKANYLWADMLLDGNHEVAFVIRLKEGENGRTFRFTFGGLNQCSFRVRLPLAAVDQNRWMLDREGAFLKPLCSGDRVDLAKVDRMTLTVLHQAPGTSRWCLTNFGAAPGGVEKLAAPLLPKGALLDELGQSTLHEWPAKTRGVDELKARLNAQLQTAPASLWPGTFSKWGAWNLRKLAEGSGFFRTHHDGRRWWLVDPDGYAFWSAGLDCVRVDTEARFDGIEDALSWKPDPNGDFRDIYRQGEAGEAKHETICYLAANMIRSFGPSGWREKWSAIALAEMKRLRFNTVGNWSEWQFAAKAGFPYVRPMQFVGRTISTIYRDFPDVFHPEFESDAAVFASQLRSTANDPAFVGYFLMNEPTWGFSSELPAAGMLYNTERCATRTELTKFLKEKYATDEALASAWGMPVTFERVAAGKWTATLTPEAMADLRAFSSKMVERYFQVLSQACRKADPNHLNLGMRWAGVPPDWAAAGMKSFDVFSLNCYQERLPLDTAAKIDHLLKMPVMVGEWHFGALDVGLPASGIGHLSNQSDRARAYRVYLEDAAADPHCVGAHWFTMYDQSALGRFDGENYNIGFLDVCNRPYEELSLAAIASHGRMYRIAEGQEAPYADAPVYLPKLFL